VYLDKLELLRESTEARRLVGFQRTTIPKPVIFVELQKTKKQRVNHELSS
jgi:hypothetical protein